MRAKIILGSVLLTVWTLLTFLVLTQMPQFAGKQRNVPGVGSTPKIEVVVTIPILKDLVVRTCEQYVNVTSLVSDEVQLLSFQQKPRDVVHIYKADLLIKVGAGLDDWVDDITRDLDRSGLKIVDLSKNVGLLDREGKHIGTDAAAYPGLTDPYFWLDPGNVREMVLAIQMDIISILPEAAKYLQHERMAYFAELNSVESEVATELAPASSIKMVAGCNGMFYFARRFNLSVVGRLDQMVPRIAQPDAARTLARTLARNNVRIIVLDPLSEQSFPGQLAELGGFKITLLASAVGLDPNANSCLALMRHHARTLMGAVKSLQTTPAKSSD
ncbi:MAG TPA: metal ABC transporter substrate-binding protein [bacterium]|nr:metal ABC transporter substrate-binding protein [bacterium]